MYKEKDYVVYRKNVCLVKEIKKNKLNGKDYYILTPIDDSSLIIDVPIDNELGYLRNVINEDEAKELINKIPLIEPIDNILERDIEKIYKDLLASGSHEDLIKIIKTSYLRNDNRKRNNKKISEKDSNYLSLAEKYLYNEISVSLNMQFDETKNYIIKKVQELTK